MKFFRDLFKGIGYFFQGFAVAFEKGLWPYMFVPLLLKALMWILTIWGVIELVFVMEKLLNDWLDLQSIPETGHLLSFAKPFLVGWLGKIIAWLMSGIVGYFLGFLSKYIILILLSPMLALVSELTEEKMTGNKYPFVFKQFLKDIWRGVLINLRNMFIEFFFICLSIPLLFVNVIPVLGQVIWFLYTFIFLKLVSAYFVGFALMDYSNERHKLSVSESAKLIRRNKGYAIGIGMVYNFFFWIPFIGDWFGIIFAPLMGAIGATLAYLEIKKTNAAQPQNLTK